MIELQAITFHEFYDATGIRVAHTPGDRYSVDDGGGMTAEHLAARLVALGWAKRIDKPKIKAAKA